MIYIFPQLIRRSFYAQFLTRLRFSLSFQSVLTNDKIIILCVFPFGHGDIRKEEPSLSPTVQNTSASHCMEPRIK